MLEGLNRVVYRCGAALGEGRPGDTSARNQHRKRTLVLKGLGDSPFVLRRKRSRTKKEKGRKEEMRNDAEMGHPAI